MQVPISYHLDLYRYWLMKRGERVMPARGDIDPADIYMLLPCLTIVEKVDDQLRYRLVGSTVARQLGRDMTGVPVGSYVDASSGSAVRAISQSVFAAARPSFATAEFQTRAGSLHAISQLLLPLSDDGFTVNMTISTRVARPSVDVQARSDWLKGEQLKINDIVTVNNVEQLQELCREWRKRCHAKVDRAVLNPVRPA